MPQSDLVEWYTLVARHARTSLAPPPLPAALLRERRAVPRIVATGAHDAFLPPRRLQRPTRELLDSTLRVIDNAGHLVTGEQPDAIASLVAELF